VLVTRAARRLRGDRAALVVTLAALSWFAFLALRIWRRHDRFETFDYDLGFHVQYVWLLSRGRAFSTIVGLPVFGHNATFGYVFFVPFAWLGVSLPHVMNLTQTAALALGVVPLFRLARRRFDASWVCVAAPVLYLLHPIVQNSVWETFHPDAMAIAPLLAAYDAGDEARWRRFWVFVALAIVWKADVSLYLAFFGAIVVRRWNPRVGWSTAALGAGWFIVTVGLLIPSQAGGEPVWGEQYGDLGGTPGEMVATTVHHPTRLIRQLDDANPAAYVRDLLAPYGFAPLLAPVTLAPAAPQLLLNTLFDPDWTRDPFIGPHYQALPLVAMTLSLLEGLAYVRRRRPGLLDPAVAVIGACALAATTSWGALPISVRYDERWIAEAGGGDPLNGVKEIAVAMPGARDAVAASGRFVPHLAERSSIYAFPNPWRPRNYGVGDVERPDPTEVEWLILDGDAQRIEAHREVLDCILAAGTFDEELRVGPILVLHRNERDPVDAACT
jgi:uncharacterized membrane protein